MCRRNTEDPLVRTFLDRYGLNLLKVPRRDAKCGDMYIQNNGRVVGPVNPEHLLKPTPELPRKNVEEPLADLNGVVSGGYEAGAGLDFLSRIIAIIGAPLVASFLGSLKSCYSQARATTLHFKILAPTRDSVDPAHWDVHRTLPDRPITPLLAMTIRIT